MSAALLLVACSIVPDVTPFPPHDATNVPVDVRPVVHTFFLDEFDVALVHATTSTIIPATITIVPSHTGDFHVIRPEEPLLPATAYELWIHAVNYAHLPEGSQVTSFWTGDGPGLAPDRPVIRSVFASHTTIDPESNGSGCGFANNEIDYLEIDARVDPRAVMHEIELRQSGQVVFTRDLWLWWSGSTFLWSGGQAPCFTITSIGLNGSRSHTSAASCAHIVQCTRREKEIDYCRSGGCSAANGAAPWLHLLAAAAATARSASRARRRGSGAGRRSP